MLFDGANDNSNDSHNSSSKKWIKPSERDGRDLEALGVYALARLDRVRMLLLDREGVKAPARLLAEAIERVDERLDAIVTRRALRHARKPVKLAAPGPTELEELTGSRRDTADLEVLVAEVLTALTSIHEALVEDRDKDAALELAVMAISGLGTGLDRLARRRTKRREEVYP